MEVVLRPGVRVADQFAAHDWGVLAAALPQRHPKRHVDQLDGLGGATFHATILWANTSRMNAT
jgi:hypothetical protein